MSHQDESLQAIIEDHNCKMREVYAQGQRRMELIDELMRLAIGGYVVLYLLVFAYEIISRLPPYVAP